MDNQNHFLIPESLVQAIAVYLQNHVNCDEITTKRSLHVSNILRGLSSLQLANIIKTDPLNKTESE